MKEPDCPAMERISVGKETSKHFTDLTYQVQYVLSYQAVQSKHFSNVPLFYCFYIIGSLHEIWIAFRHTWLESVFHADSHGIFYFFFKSTEMCVFLM